MRLLIREDACRGDIMEHGDAGSTPLTDGEHVYVFIFEATPGMSQVAHDSLDDDSAFNATPPAATDALCLRSNKFLYCLGK